MSTLESDGRVPDLQLRQPCFLSRDELRLGELIVGAENDRERRSSCQTGRCVRIEFGRQQPGVKHYAVRIYISARDPTGNGGRTLREAEHPQSHLGSIHYGENFVMEPIEITHVVLNLALAILRGHPARADGHRCGVRAHARRLEVESRQGFRSNEEAIGPLQGQETRKEPSGQLTMTMADDPYFVQVHIERAHDRIPRGPRDLQVALLESANHFFRRDGYLHETLDKIPGVQRVQYTLSQSVIKYDPRWCSITD